MRILYAVGLLCIVAVGPGSAEKALEVVVRNYTLQCDKPLVFNGKDNQAACFAKCTPGKCQAAVYLSSGQPGKPTCALMPTNATCKPDHMNGRGYTLKIIVPNKKMFSVVRKHDIGGGGYDLDYYSDPSRDFSKENLQLGFYYPTPLSMTGSDGCFAFCLFVKGCNAIRTDGSACQLFKFIKRPEVHLSENEQLCGAQDVVYYENDKLAPTGECVEVNGRG